MRRERAISYCRAVERVRALSRVSTAGAVDADADESGGFSVAVTLTINGRSVSVNVSSSTNLLWVLRDTLNMTGTKYGCGNQLCGACTVLVDGVAQTSCNLKVSSLTPSNQITTIEGLSPTSSHPVQQAWVAQQVPQCGFCQSGMILSAVSLLKSNPAPTDADIDAAITNICVCGTYQRVRAAIHQAAG